MTTTPFPAQTPGLTPFATNFPPRADVYLKNDVLARNGRRRAENIPPGSDYAGNICSVFEKDRRLFNTHQHQKATCQAKLLELGCSWRNTFEATTDSFIPEHQRKYRLNRGFPPAG